MKKEKIVTIIVLVILFAEMISIPSKFLYNKIIRNDTNTNNITINWEEKYPFEQDKGKVAKLTIIQKYKNFIDKIIGMIETATNNNVLMHDELVYLYGSFNKNIGMKIVKDIESTNVFLESGQFNYLYPPRENLTQTIQDVIDLKKYVEEKNMNFMYVQTPLKLFAEKDIIPGCIDNYIYKDKARLREELKKKNVDAFDVATYLSGEYNEYMEYFYDTDHHWKIETGLKVAALLAEELNQKYNFEIDVGIYDIENYNIKTYKNGFLGSSGKKVTLGYTEAENFNLITPKQIQNWHVTIPQVGIDDSGDFDLILDEKVLKIEDLYKTNPYAAYTYGDQPYISIKNNKDGLKGKVLVVGDSFAEVIVPFLAMGCEQVDRIDLRHFNGSLRNFLENNHYDVVMLLQSRPGENYDAESHNSGWDFR